MGNSNYKPVLYRYVNVDLESPGFIHIKFYWIPGQVTL